jgi:hypothetical protein
VSAPFDWGLAAALVAYQQAFDGSARVVPVGLGLGRVSRLNDGNVLNLYLEPQYSVVQSGIGQPAFQVFAGVNIQFPAGRAP